MIAGLLLAAGQGRRFGGDKLGALLQGRAIVRWSAETLRGVDRTYVVVPVVSDLLRDALADVDGRFVINLTPEEGISSSIRVGINAMADDIDAVIIALGDQPLVDPRIATLLGLRWRAGDVVAVAARYLDGQGHPVLIARECFAELLSSLEGDTGARGFLAGLGNRVAYVDVDQRMPVDVDTPDVLAMLESRIAE